jgi:hypothetical protein
VYLVFQKNGVGGVVADDVSLPYTLDFLESCALDVTANQQYSSSNGPIACDTLPYPSGCTGSACGVCSCRLSAAPLNFDRWSVSGTKLVFGGGSVDFCVQGDTMTTATNGIIHEWARRTLGTPTPCEGRSLATCRSERSEDFCRPGSCDWLPSELSSVNYCSDLLVNDQSHCESNSACHWNTSACGGKALAECSAADFGRVPGCELYPPGTKCTGIPKPCAGYDKGICADVPGCSLVTGCSGGKQSCEAVFAAEHTCYLSSGCRSLASGSCTGTIDCAQIRLEEGCYEKLGCTWNTKVCTGTPPSCDTYSLGQCEQHGCTIGIP